MPRDADLDRLKMEQTYAFQRKQQAKRTLDDAWSRRESARGTLDSAHHAKQDAHEDQQGAWEELQRIRDRNGPRIDALNGQQETAFQNMRDAFDRASAAHDARDGASARYYADEGHRYKAEAQEATAGRRGLVQEIRDARDRHNATKPAFQHAKAEFDSAKAEHDRAKSEHEQAQSEYRHTRDDFDKAKSAFRARLEAVRNERHHQRNDNRALAERAGVPSQYLDDVWISTQSDGSINIYFGGTGSPNGPGHGHYVIDSTGTVTYRRDPYNEHGGQNFTDSQQDYDDVIWAENNSGGEFGFRCRFRGFDAFVESNTNKHGEPKIDIYYGPQGPFAPGHHHAVALREDPFTFVYDEYR